MKDKNQNKKSSINPNAAEQFLRKKKKKRSQEEWLKGIQDGNTVVLSQAITLIESTLPTHQFTAKDLMRACLPLSGNSIRIGITGTPGVGKSTFIEALGQLVLAQGKKLAVLPVDPSSQTTGGSILGDKTRMEKLAANPDVFIRPSPARDSLGGVAQKTRENILLCEAAGYEVIFVETVGVGQSEIHVHSMVDFFLLILQPAAGDELQGIKRGVMELADLIAVNKADGALTKAAKQAKQTYKNALHLFPAKASGWTPTALTCSAIENEGLEKIWETINDFIYTTKNNNYFKKRRKEQAIFWFREGLLSGLKSLLYDNKKIQEAISNLEQAILEDKISPLMASRQVINLIKNNL